jgi:uncharacterized LabA/DUF88 family protein
MDDLYVFIDNSFLFIQGYRHVGSVAHLPPNKKPQINYIKFREYIATFGTVKRIVLVGSELAGILISTCQRYGFTTFTLPRYPNMVTGKKQEKGVDQKIGWEIAKTIFTNKDSTTNKKVILCSGDKDFMSILSDIQTANWNLEVWMWGNAHSKQYETEINIFGKMVTLDSEWRKFIDIVDK